LAEAEARAAVAASDPGATGALAAANALVADLRIRLEQSDARVKQTTEQTQQLQTELVKAKADAAKGTAPTVQFRPSENEISGAVALERVRVAEAKASKAIAAARAAAAGLTVSPEDLSAIESGLVVTSIERPKQTPWVLIMGAFIGGLAIMFGVTKLIVSN